MRKIRLANIFLLLIFLTSCTKNNIFISYNETNASEYINIFYETSIDENAKYVAFDLRSKEEYETNHIKQYQNYDLSKGSFDEFTEYIENNFGKHTIVFIYYDGEELKKNEIEMIKKGYEKIYSLNCNFETIDNNEKIIYNTGPYDCGC